MIRVQNITKSYGDIQAVSGISFELSEGEVVGFLGPNGAGKTTTMRILAGYIPPTSGKCWVEDFDVSANPILARQKIGYLPESTPLYGDMEVSSYLGYIGSLRGMKKTFIPDAIKKVVHTCGLKKVIGRKIATLSKGYKQRIGLAQALIHEPPILILDEPTVGLDPNQIIEIRDLIRNIGKNRTVFLSSHILSEVEQTCERMIIISEGSIVAEGSPKELAHQNQKPVCRVGISATQEQIQNALTQLPEVHAENFEDTNDGIVFFNLSFKGSEDHRSTIYHWTVKNNFVLMELVQEKISLEKIFQKLTAA